MLFLEILCWLVLSLLAMSLIEYVVHRYPMHNLRFVNWFTPAKGVFERHALLHHHRFYKDFSHDDDPAAKHISLKLDVLQNVLGLSPVWGVLLYVAPLGAAVLLFVAVAHALVWNTFHAEMHEPSGRWFARTSVYRYIAAYHHTHHLHPGSNFNILLPGVDWLFGTYRTPVTPRS